MGRRKVKGSKRMSKAQIKAKHPPNTSQGHIDKMYELMGPPEKMEFGPAHNRAEELGYKAFPNAKSNPSKEHWLSMNLDFQKGVVKESAIEWAQAVANRDNRPYFVAEDDGMWFVTTNKTPLRIDPVKSNPHGGKNCGCGQDPCITYGNNTNPPKSKSSPKGNKVSIPYTPGSVVERNIAIVSWAQKEKTKLGKKSKKYSGPVIAFADQKGNALTFVEILDMQDKAGKKAIPAIMLEDNSVQAVFKSNPPISSSRDYADYGKSTADVLVRLLPDVTNLEIENMKATVGSRRAAVELALGKKPSDYTVEGFGTDFVRDEKGQYVPKSLLAYQVLGVRPTRDASMDARFKTQLRTTLSGILGVVTKDGKEEPSVGLPFIEEQIFLTASHVADYRQMIKLYHELHERNKAYCETILPGLPSKGFVGGIKAEDVIEALLPSPDALFIGEEIALIVPIDPKILQIQKTGYKNSAEKILQGLYDIVTGVQTEPSNMDDLVTHRKFAAILSRRFKNNKKKMATAICKAVATSLANFPRGYDGLDKSEQLKSEIITAQGQSDKYKSSLVHIKNKGKKTGFAVIQLQTTGFNKPPIGWDRRWMIPTMQVIHEHWEMLEVKNGLEIHDMLYLIGIRAKDLFDYEIKAREWLIMLFLLGVFNSSKQDSFDVKKALIDTTSSKIMEEFTNLKKMLIATKKTVNAEVVKENPPRLMRAEILRNNPSMSILPMGDNQKLKPTFSFLKGDEENKFIDVATGITQEKIDEITKEVKELISEQVEDNLEPEIKDLAKTTIANVKASKKTIATTIKKLKTVEENLKRESKKSTTYLIDLRKAKSIIVALNGRYTKMKAGLEALLKSAKLSGVELEEEDKNNIIKGLKQADDLAKQLKNKFQTIDETKKGVEKELKGLRDEIGKGSLKEISEANKKASSLSKEIDTLKKSSEKETKELTEQITGLNTQIETLESSKKVMETLVDSIKDKIKNSRFASDAAISKESENVVEELSKFEALISELKDKSKVAADKLTSKTKEIFRITKASDKVKTNLEEAKDKISEYAERLNTSQTALGIQTDVNEGLAKLSEAQRKEIGQLQNEKSDLNQELSDLNMSVDDANKAINSLMTSGGKRGDYDIRAKKDIEIAMTTLGKRIGDVKSQLIQVRKESQDLNTEVTKLHSIREQFGALYNALKSMNTLKELPGIDGNDKIDMLHDSLESLVNEILIAWGTESNVSPDKIMQSQISLGTLTDTIVKIYDELQKVVEGSKLQAQLASGSSAVSLTKETATDLIRLYEKAMDTTQLASPLLQNNPRNNPRDSQGPFKSQTQARQVARVMSERGEDVYMWDCPRTGGYMVSLNHPTDIPASKVKRFPASSKPNPQGKYHKYEKKVIEILKKEGGAAGLKALRPAFPKKTSKAKAESMLAKMNNVTQHQDGDYILLTGIMNNPFIKNHSDYQMYFSFFNGKALPYGSVIEYTGDDIRKKRLGVIPHTASMSRSATLETGNQYEIVGSGYYSTYGDYGLYVDPIDYMTGEKKENNLVFLQSKLMKDGAEGRNFKVISRGPESQNNVSVPRANPPSERKYKGVTISKVKGGYETAAYKNYPKNTHTRLKDAKAYIDAISKGFEIYANDKCVLYTANNSRCNSYLRTMKNGKMYICTECGGKYKKL